MDVLVNELSFKKVSLLFCWYPPHYGLFLLGVRTFTPSTASNGFLYVGGPAVVLSLVAMAPDDGSMYAAVKVLLSVLETNPAMQQEMHRINGYKVCQIF